VRLVACVAVAALLGLAGCGGDDDQTLTVAAASSLSGAFTECGGGAQLEFGGSDDLAAQVRQGVGIDVLAAANMGLPRQLADEGKAQPPVPFATNELVLAVPRNSGIASLPDLNGASIAIGSPSVPVGAYAQQLLDRLPAPLREVIRRGTRTQEPDAKSIVGKLATGAVDAGFVYATDVRASDALKAVHLPARLQPTVEYGISVVRDGDDARAFVARVLHGACATALRKAGFGLPRQ
jgi:molybdate transport system substrate-binding protein